MLHKTLCNASKKLVHAKYMDFSYKSTLLPVIDFDFK